MVGIILNHRSSDEERRGLLFSGEYLVNSATPATLALAAHAQNMIRDGFAGLDPESAQDGMEVSAFIERVAPLKSAFTNHQRTKELIRDVLVEYGCDLTRTYFDVPRMRVVPHSGYLSAGVSYAYKAHRDTWYSSPHAQVNYWMPIFSVTPQRAMSMFPEYWDTPVENSSGDFDYDEWCRVGRQQAVSQTTVDTRKHPLPLAPVETRSDTRISGMPGDMFMFSAAHLHSTAPNTSGKTRFSMDFRTVNLDDIERGNAAHNVDCRATGTTLGDFLRADDFSKISPDLVERERVPHAA
jgi:hypothetical protein